MMQRHLRKVLGGKRGRSRGVPAEAAAPLSTDPRLRPVVELLEARTEVDSVAVQVLRQAALDPSDMVALARVVARDPELAGRLVGVAELTAVQRVPVREASHAAVVLGPDVVRSLAALRAVGELTGPPPPGFRGHAVAAAAGCAAVADLVGLPRQRALALGLVHDVGWPVVARLGREVRTGSTARRLDEADGERREREALGFTHAEASAVLLERWGSEPCTVAVVRHHHEPLGGAPDGAAPMRSVERTVLAAGDALAQYVMGGAARGFAPADPASFGFDPDTVVRLLDATRELAAELLEVIG